MASMPMARKDNSLQVSPDRLAWLEAENQRLLEANKRLESDMAAAVSRLREQLAIEKRYEESQSRFQTLFYQSKLGNKIIGPDLRILQTNEALQAMLGYTEQELVGTQIMAYAHPDYKSHWQELQQHLWTKQIPSFEIETCLIRKDGTVLWVKVVSIIFKDQQTTLGYTILEDISARKALELKLKKLYDNQEAMVHMVVHDLKSPLFTIQLFGGLVKENLEKMGTNPPELVKESLGYIDIIRNTCEETFIIIKDLLLIGELETTTAAVEETNLTRLFQHHLPLLEVGARQKGISIYFHHPEAPVPAQINPEELRRLLSNLVSNAIKFTHPGGHIDLVLEDKGPQFLLQVRDTGIGIPPNLQDLIFQKFTKAKRPGTQGEKTTGLGLYIVKQIVEKYNGRIWVESQPDAGTTFFVEMNKNLDTSLKTR